MKKLIIEKNKLENNIRILKEKAGGTKILAMLKGNGYGLGICQFAGLLIENGIEDFCVSELEEALALREGGISDNFIVLLSPLCDFDRAKKAIESSIVCSVGSEESALILDAAAKELGVHVQAHVAFDTGFGRFGFLKRDTKKAIDIISELEYVSITGAFTHLSDSFGKEENSRKQFEAFKEMAEEFENAGIKLKMKHICNSCAFLRYPDMYLDAVRVGSAFLGRLPISNNLGLERIAYLESRICEVKLLPKGYNIGYANTYTTKKETKIAVIPVGYKDGYGVLKQNDTFRVSDILRYVYHNLMLLFRDNRTYVKINGKSCPLLGRISMFNIIADITDVGDAEVGNAVRLECNPIMIDSSVVREYI